MERVVDKVRRNDAGLPSLTNFNEGKPLMQNAGDETRTRR